MIRPVLLMDVLPDIGRMVDEAIYSLLLMVAEMHWSLQRAVLMMGYTIKVVIQWLVEQAFVPLITQTSNSLDLAVSVSFVIALFVLGITYMLAAFVRLEVVNFRSALTWYVAGALFFAVGPNLYRSMNTFRTDIGQLMYLSALSGLQGSTSGSFNSLTQVSSTDLDLGPTCDYLDVYLDGATAPGPIDGLDIALSYLRAHGRDVMGYEPPITPTGQCGLFLMNPHPMTDGYGTFQSSLPMDWVQGDSYFDWELAGNRFDVLDGDERDQSISQAGASQGRALTAWPLIIFGVSEQIVHLLITIAMGITFVSFAVAILFAFFKRTESIAQSVIDQWIELIIQTAMISLVQALVIAFFLAGTATGNVTVVIGVGSICLVFMLIVLWSGVKAVWNSFNRLFSAVSRATGQVFVTPGAATAATASAGASALGATTGAGASALAGMQAIRSGATAAQAAGLTFGGFGALSGAARSLAYLPGVRNTSLGEAAEQFTEGATTRDVARQLPGVGQIVGPMVGRRLLTDRDPDKAEYDDEGRVLSRPMLIPAVGEGLDNWTLPRGARRRPAGPVDYFENEDGEMLPLGGPSRRTRMGTFTPVTPSEPDTALQAERRQQRSDYADEQRGEELEQHVSDVMRTSTGVASPLGAMLEKDDRSDNDRLTQGVSRLEQAADNLRQAGLQLGQLRVSGSENVAGVMADVVAQNQPGQSLDHLRSAQLVAQAIGVIPSGENPPIQQDLARFGLFLDQATKLGLSPTQTEKVVREVQSSPDGKLKPETRDLLDKQVQTGQNLSWIKARDEVNRLEHSAGMLPREIVAFGTVKLPTQPKDDTK